MKWTSLNELRELYLSFFESKGHLRLKSFPLIPQNDNSLLLINSGMAPMKKYFTGEVTPPSKRVTTCQKCIRTPDIERVGKTARHGTYFEMLGNFSFGDYFKRDAAKWAWEFCTKVLEMPPERLWVTIYEEDDEAFDVWTKEVGFPGERIVRMGKADNFWEHGTGPCGPCSELYFDRGQEHGCGDPNCAVGCECDRFVEFWNLVFTQFDSDGQGNYTPLANPNIDTGMGLERLACIMQGVDNLFEVDTVEALLKEAGKIAGVAYKSDPKSDISLRVITDHLRSTTFMIADGVIPSNEGRGYVLRRLLRRAARHGRLLGIRDTCLYQLCETVIACNEGAYPELRQKADYIKKLIRVEEESFGRTIDQGLSLLTDLMDKADGKVLSGADAFRLYDTYGFPPDLTVDILAERGMTMDEEEFSRLMSEQRSRARQARKAAGSEGWTSGEEIFSDLPPTKFTGYDSLSSGSKVIAIVKESGKASAAYEGESVAVVLNESPFYAEGGGQAGDTGILENEQARLRVTDTVKTAGGVYLHKAVVESGILSEGETLKATPDREKRLATMRNHTSAHLLQAALRLVLGTHVEQAGQMVDDRRMRFDFTHFSAMTREELQAVEDHINGWILAALPVDIQEMSLEEARSLGAMALFGEKYGDVVRVVSVEGTSAELCGGTHVENTSRIGLFRIVSESSVAAGVRRIEAVTGAHVLELLSHYRGLLQSAGEALKTGNPEEVPMKAEQMAGLLKEREKEIQTLRSQIAGSRLDALISEAKEVGGLKLITALMPDTEAEDLRLLCDRIKEQLPGGVAVLASVFKEKGNLTFAAACGAQAVAAGAHAGNLVRGVAKIAGGSGGGRPDSAMAGGKEPQKAPQALEAAGALLLEMLK